jgi:membrane-bound serine protease (ClpP class)
MRGLRIALGAVLAGVGLLSSTTSQAQSTAPTVMALQLDGVVDTFMADYLQANIERSGTSAAVLIEIDTPGGLDSSMRQITQAILNSQTPVICYVSPQGARAASAGAFVLESCSVAAMAPGTNVGASTPVGLDGGDLSRKVANDAAAYIRSLAETHGRNADVAASFVTEGVSISAAEALDRNVIDAVSPTREQLLRDVDGRAVVLGTGEEATLATEGAAIDDVSMGGFVGFLHGLLDPNLAFIFFWFGLMLIVLELLVPGHIFSGTVGTILLVLALFGFGVLPVRWIGIGLLVAAVILFVIELSAPGLGVWGILGTVALVLGGWFLYDRSAGVSVSPVVLLPMAALIAGFFGFVVAKVMRMRDLPPVQGPEAIVGRDGVVVGVGTDAHGGVVRVAAEEWKATSSHPLSPGTRIRVTALDGLVLTVEPLGNEHAPAADAAPAGEGGTT